MSVVTGGEAIVAALIDHQVDTVFALPGVQNDHLFNAFYDRHDDLRVLHTRHEQGAAYMALGYALTAQKPGVYTVVPGPGFLNTTAALSTAYARNAPVLCLTGQIRTTELGRGYGLLHELPDQLGIMQSLTKWASRISSVPEAPLQVSRAFAEMKSGRTRPVALECPMDILATRTEADLPATLLPVYRPPLDCERIAAAAELLANAKRPAIFIGGGAAEAGEEILTLAEALQAPIFATYNGRGIVSERHYLSHSMTAAYGYWEKADVVLAVGTRLQGPLQTWGYDDDLKIIRIDIDPEEHFRITAPAVSLLADARDGLGALIPAVEKLAPSRSSCYDEMMALKDAANAQYERLEPQMSYVKVIREELPDDGYYVEEMTQISYVARYAMPFYLPRTCVTTGYQGTLGWGFATALGVKVANPDKPVISVTGDGGFLFTATELATAVQHRIPTITLVFNDGAYGNVRRMQRDLYDGRVIASELTNPDFVKMAESFGAQGLRAHSVEELRAAIQRGFEADVPTIVDIPVGEMPAPWHLYFRQRIRPRAS